MVNDNFALSYFILRSLLADKILDIRCFTLLRFIPYDKINYELGIVKTKEAISIICWLSLPQPNRQFNGCDNVMEWWRSRRDLLELRERSTLFVGFAYVNPTDNLMDVVKGDHL